MTAGLILSIMITPIITSISREVIETCPQTDRDGALALGATRWEMITGAVLPHSMTGIVGAVMLGLGRAMGETIAVALVIGSSPTITANLFSSGDSLPSVIAFQWGEATSEVKRSALIAMGLTLFILTILVNLIATGVVNRADPTSAGGVAVAVAAVQLPPTQALAAELAGISGRRRTKNRVMTVLMALTVIVVGGRIGPGAHHRDHQGMVDRFRQLPGLVHQGHPAGATPSGSRHEGGHHRHLRHHRDGDVDRRSARHRRRRLPQRVRTHPPVRAGAAIPRQRDGRRPSIVMGLFIYVFWVVPRGVDGLNGLSGALALACLMLPIVVRSSEEMLRLVPQNLRDASYALGGSTSRTTLTVVLPKACPGVISGCLLADRPRCRRDCAADLHDRCGQGDQLERLRWHQHVAVDADLRERQGELRHRPGTGVGCGTHADRPGVPFTVVRPVAVCTPSQDEVEQWRRTPPSMHDCTLCQPSRRLSTR